MTTPTLPGLEPTRREQASGFLGATLIVLGLLTAFMLVTWLTQQRHDGPVVSRVAMRANDQEQGSGSSGEAEVFRLLDGVENDDVSPAIEQATERLQLVSNLATSEFAAMEQSGGRKGKGIGDEIGDDRMEGPPRGPVVPNSQRWQIRYAAANIQEYAAILDAFEVELGVLGGSQHIDYASHLSAQSPKVRQGLPKDENRLRFTFQQGELRESDRTLAEKSGLNVEGRVVSQFFPDKVRQQLELLEREAIGARPLASVRHTQFGIRRGSRGLEFYVLRVEPARVPTGLAPL